ncbi:recQ-mediated genome instability protein 1 [Tetranychus urticae]|uniref:RecQ-mediated genome instability protein 1 n=1 Tax=Tetranychus urticae TaxID=32264 RepID=T1KTF5_TETUR|nr:recQ-mediated genome instability protein 1 [Tetranychus urticae]
MSSISVSFTPLPMSLLNDFNEEKLVGNYTLQLVSIRDISKPPYDQENEFLRLDEEPEEGDVDETLKGKVFKPSQPVKKQNDKAHGPRMLCLNLSDGKNVVKAIEHQHIAFLKPDLPIGSRILIKGPVDVSFKVLLLQSQNIQIIGPPLPGSSLPKVELKPELKPDLKPKVESPVLITSQSSSLPSTQSTIKSLSQRGSTSSITNCSVQSKTQCDDKSIIDISDTTADEHMYYLDGLDDEILE